MAVEWATAWGLVWGTGEATVDMEDLGVDDRVVALVEGLEEDRVGVGNDRELLDVACERIQMGQDDQYPHGNILYSCERTSSRQPSSTWHSNIRFCDDPQYNHSGINLEIGESGFTSIADRKDPYYRASEVEIGHHLSVYLLHALPIASRVEYEEA